MAQHFGLDESLLREMVNLHLTQGNINEYNRFDKLIASVYLEKAKRFFEQETGTEMSNFEVNLELDEYLRKFLVECWLGVSCLVLTYLNCLETLFLIFKSTMKNKFRCLIDTSLLELFPEGGGNLQNKHLLSYLNGFESGDWRYSHFNDFIFDNICETALSKMNVVSWLMGHSHLFVRLPRTYVYLKILGKEVNWQKYYCME